MYIPKKENMSISTNKEHRFGRIFPYLAFLFLLFPYSVSAISINNENLPLVNPHLDIDYVNYTTVNVNNSNFLEGYTWATNPYFNQWSSTYNSSYALNSSLINYYLVSNPFNFLNLTTLASSNVVVNTLNVTGNVNLGGNLKILGNLSVKRPYWNGYDNSTQTFLNIANTQVINISNNNDFDNYGIRVVGNQNLTFDMTGDYLCVLSPEFHLPNGAGANKIATFWIQKNGVDIPWSNSRYTISANDYNAPAITYQFDIVNPATDNIRFLWWSDSTSMEIISISGLTLPTRPSIPGVLVNCQKVSELTI